MPELVDCVALAETREAAIASVQEKVRTRLLNTQILHQPLTNRIRGYTNQVPSGSPVPYGGKPSFRAGLTAFADLRKIRGLRPAFVGDVAVRVSEALATKERQRLPLGEG